MAIAVVGVVMIFVLQTTQRLRTQAIIVVLIAAFVFLLITRVALELTAVLFAISDNTRASANWGAWSASQTNAMGSAMFERGPQIIPTAPAAPLGVPLSGYTGEAGHAQSPPEEVSVCSRCGSQRPAGDHFCGICGHPIEATTT